MSIIILLSLEPQARDDVGGKLVLRIKCQNYILNGQLATCTLNREKKEKDSQHFVKCFGPQFCTGGQNGLKLRV